MRTYTVGPILIEEGARVQDLGWQNIQRAPHPERRGGWGRGQKTGGTHD